MFVTFDNVFHVYLMRGFQKYARNWILTMAFWATCKIAQPIQPIWQHIFALSWSALKKPPWDFKEMALMLPLWFSGPLFWHHVHKLNSCLFQVIPLKRWEEQVTAPQHLLNAMKFKKFNQDLFSWTNTTNPRFRTRWSFNSWKKEMLLN
jgi:hypothetical protein